MQGTREKSAVRTASESGTSRASYVEVQVWLAICPRPQGRARDRHGGQRPGGTPRFVPQTQAFPQEHQPELCC